MHTHRQCFFANALLVATCAVAIPTTAVAQEHTPECAVAPIITPLDPTLPLHRTSDPNATTLRALRALCGAEDGLVQFTPELFASSQSGVPDARHTTTATPGIGASWQIRAGVEFRRGALFIRASPEVSWTSNADFLIFPGRDITRNSFASPFYHGARSADLPSRFGDRPTLRLDPGESGIWLLGARSYFAATTALPAWGPGVGEGLVLGRTAAGLPRLEAGLAQPTSIGAVTLRWFAGAASESPFFDTIATNNVRPMGGLRVALEREHVAIGLSRTVMDGRADGGKKVLSAAFHPLVNVAQHTDSVIEFLSADLLLRRAESGTLGWIEVARQAPLRAARDFFLLPAEGLALRVGFSQRLIVTPRARWILALEAVRLDQPAQRTDRPQQDLYTSATVVQGWTHRGKPLGSGLGPGGQRQFISLDREGSVWAIGGFVERARWNDDALYREFLPYHLRHDVSLQVGGRAARRWRAHDVAITLSAGTRLNYLFQNAEWIPGYRTSDIRVAQLGLSLTPVR